MNENERQAREGDVDQSQVDGVDVGHVDEKRVDLVDRKNAVGIERNEASERMIDVKRWQSDAMTFAEDLQLQRAQVWTGGQSQRNNGRIVGAQEQSAKVGRLRPAMREGNVDTPEIDVNQTRKGVGENIASELSGRPEVERQGQGEMFEMGHDVGSNLLNLRASCSMQDERTEVNEFS